MFEADDIRDWKNRNVVDQDGSKIGSLEGVYYDTATQVPAFASVQVGIVGRHKLTFVPLEGVVPWALARRRRRRGRPDRTHPL